MIIERQHDENLVAWINPELATKELEIQLREDKNILATWSFSDISFEIREERYYFQLALISSNQADAVVDGSLRLLLIHSNREEFFKIFNPLQETLKLRTLDLSRLGSTFKLLPNSHREAFRRAVEYSTKTNTRSAVKRQRACIITYANDSGGWFEAFKNHYSKQLGGTSRIYVITPNPESFREIKLGGITGLIDFAYDDYARSQMLSNMAKALSAYYEWVIVADVDELIFAESIDGIGARTLFDRLGDNNLPEINFSLGLDIIQTAQETDYNPSISLLKQRRYAVPNSGMCKPHITRGTVNLDIGYHYCQVPPRIPTANAGFVMFHLKYACQTTRQDVARIVERTDYTNSRIQNYAYDSVGRRTGHPGLKFASHETALPLNQWDRLALERRILAKIRYDADRDLYIGEHFTEDLVIDLKVCTTE